MTVQTKQTEAILHRSGSRETLHRYILTSCNARFFDALIVLIESLNRNAFEEFDQIHVYDIGLDEAQRNELAVIPRVNIIEIPFREKTEDYIKSYAFKIDMMHLAQNYIQTNLDKTLLLYLDAGVLVNRSLSDVWKIIQEKDFYITDMTDRMVGKKTGDKIRLFNFSPDDVVDELDIPNSTLAKPLLRPNIFGFRLNSAFYNDVIAKAFDLAQARPHLITGYKFSHTPAAERSERIQQFIRYCDDAGIDRIHDHFNGHRHDQFLFTWLIHNQGYGYERATGMIFDVTDVEASKQTYDGVFNQTMSLDELSKRRSEIFLVHRNGVRRDFQPSWTRMDEATCAFPDSPSAEVGPSAHLKNGTAPTPMAQRLKDKIVIIGQVDYHIRNAASFARELHLRGHRSVILDNSGFVEGGRRQFPEAEMHVILDAEYIKVDKGPYEIDWLSTAKLVLVFHDWNKDFSDALDYRRTLGLPTVGVVEGINDFLRVDSKHRSSLPYRQCDYVFLAGENDRKYFADRKTMIAGLPIIEKLSKRSPAFPGEPFAILNVNFTYGVLEDARDQFITKARDAFIATGFDWKITRHPADKGNLRGLPVSDFSQYELIDKCSVFVSRFATGILEALASGKPAIYFNPHGEKVDKFKEPLGAFDVASTEEELVAALHKVCADIAAGVDFRERALPFLKHHTNYVPDGPSVAERVADAVGTVLSEVKRTQPTMLRESLVQTDAKQPFEVERERVIFGEFSRAQKARINEEEMIARYFGDRGELMIDVGVNFGNSCDVYLRKGWTVHAFEPDPNNRRELLKAWGSNPQLIVNEEAVSDKAGLTVPFYASDESTGISGLSAFTDGHKKIAEVQTTTLKDYYQKTGIKHVDFLKIDVEGFDKFVLDGFPWEKDRPEVVLAEFEDRKTVPLGYSTDDLVNAMIAQGYFVYVSEWYPIVRYGVAHDWRRFIRYTPELDLSRTWGNLIGFLRDPEEDALRVLVEQSVKSTPVKTKTAPSQKVTNVEKAERKPLSEKEINGPILFLIISCVAYKERRDVLKDYYAKHLRKGDKAIFVVGGAKKTLYNRKTDTLHLAAGDLYEDLPEKVLKAIAFAHQNFEYRYLFKVDDDVVINFDLFYPAVSNVESDYFGRRVPSVRGSKPSETWHFGKTSESSKYFNKPFKFNGGPTYWACGGIYGLSKRATSEIDAAVTNKIEFSDYIYEDHTIATILSTRGGIQPFFFCDSPIFSGYTFCQTHLGSLLDATKTRLDARKLRSAANSVITLHCGPFPPSYKLTRKEVVGVMRRAMSEFATDASTKLKPPLYAAFGERLRKRSPQVFAILRFARRALAGLWRRRAFTVPGLVAITGLAALGLLPALSDYRGALWIAAGFSAVLFALFYLGFRVFHFATALGAETAALRTLQKKSGSETKALNARVARQDRVAAELRRRLNDLSDQNAILREALEEKITATRSDLCATVAAVEQSLKAEVAATIESAQSNGIDLKSEIDAAKATAEKALQDAIATAKEVSQVNGEVLRSEIADAKSAVEKALAGAIAHSSQSAQSAREALKAEIETSKSADDALRAEINKAATLAKNAEAAATSSRKEISVRNREAQLLRERVAASERQIGAMRFPNAPTTLVFFGHHKCASRFFRNEVFAIAAEATGSQVRKYEIKEPPFHYSMSDDLDLCNMDFNGLGEESRDVVLFSNATARSLNRIKASTKDWKGIRILRDPRQVLVSNYFHHKGDHLSEYGGWIWDQLANDKPILRELSEEEGLLYELDNISKQIIETQLLADFDDERILTIKIEDFSRASQTSLATISEFLCVPDLAGIDYTRTAANPESGPWRQHFTSKLRSVFKERYGQALIDLGYAENFDW